LYQALYRKWRSKNFDDLFGQNHIVDVLRKQCQSGKTSHAYLFCGSRGTGKTSTAKILAKAVNCLSPKDGNPCGVCESCVLIDSGSSTDISEIDAASNNSVDNIRDLRDEVIYAPAALKNRVYIIDEVHMLSTSAFNALLKTLEEPPENVIFVLATTELNKIPPTILSRCQRFEFRRIDASIIKERLLYVAKQENINLAEEAAELISRLADGGMRDALSMLDSCIGGDTTAMLDLQYVQQRLGISSAGSILLMLEHIVNNNIIEGLMLLKTLHSSAKDLTSFLTDLLKLVRDLLIYSKTKNTNNISTFYEKNEQKKFNILSSKLTTEELLYYADILEDTYFRMNRYSQNKLFELEMTIMKMCDPTLNDSTKSIAARLSKLEYKVSSGIEIKSEKKSTQSKRTEDVEIHASQPKLIENPVESIPEIESPIRTPLIQTEPKKNTSDGVEEDFEEISDYLNEMKQEPQLYSLLEVSKLKLYNNELRVYCDSFTTMFLKQKSSLIKLQDGLNRVFGNKYTIKIADKSVETKTKSAIDDITIFD